MILLPFPNNKKTYNPKLNSLKLYVYLYYAIKLSATQELPKSQQLNGAGLRVRVCDCHHAPHHDGRHAAVPAQASWVAEQDGSRDAGLAAEPDDSRGAAADRDAAEPGGSHDAAAGAEPDDSHDAAVVPVFCAVVAAVVDQAFSPFPKCCPLYGSRQITAPPAAQSC